MARKAFLYTGVTFLVMMTVLITANYFLLSEHTRASSKSTILEIDAVNNLVSDVRHVTVSDMNSTLDDALTDVGFLAINQTCWFPQSPVLYFVTILTPSNPASDPHFINVSKWLLNYTNITLSKIKSLSSLNVNFSSLVSNNVKFSTGFQDNLLLGRPVPPYYIFALNYVANLSYTLTYNGSTFIQLNQTLQKNKQLTITQLTPTATFPRQFCVYVTDQDTSNTEFRKAVICSSSTCLPTSSFNC